MAIPRPRLIVIALGPLVALIVAVSACASSAGPGQSSAGSCASGNPSAYLAAARTVFIGVMLSGPTVGTGEGSVLASPARVRVLRYLKGSGPAEVTVTTGVARAGDAIIGNAEDIEPRAGQRWMIYTASRAMPYQTSVCGGTALDHRP
jgi:hypothetical protein